MSPNWNNLCLQSHPVNKFKTHSKERLMNYTVHCTTLPLTLLTYKYLVAIHTGPIHRLVFAIQTGFWLLLIRVKHWQYLLGLSNENNDWLSIDHTD